MTGELGSGCTTGAEGRIKLWWRDRLKVPN